MKKIIIAIVVSAVGVAVWAYARPDSRDANSYRFVSVERGDLESVVSSKIQSGAGAATRIWPPGQFDGRGTSI